MPRRQLNRSARRTNVNRRISARRRRRGSNSFLPNSHVSNLGNFHSNNSQLHRSHPFHTPSTDSYVTAHSSTRSMPYTRSARRTTSKRR